MTRTLYRAQDHAFGQRILALRTAIDLTQAELADLLGVSRRAIVDWEAGESYPKPHHLQQFIRLCVEYNVFPVGREAEEVRDLWRAARQKMLLDEQWLQAALAQPAVSPPQAPIVQPERSITPPTHPQGVPYNLPSMLTPCLGRASEIELITRYLSDPDRRLISLVGIGGVGKTRLALEVV